MEKVGVKPKTEFQGLKDASFQDKVEILAKRRYIWNSEKYRFEAGMSHYPGLIVLSCIRFETILQTPFYKINDLVDVLGLSHLRALREAEEKS